MGYQGERRGTTGGVTEVGTAAGLAPGRRTLTEALQLKARGNDEVGAPVQCAGQAGGGHPDAQAIAAHGLSGAPTTMPHVDRIQRLFGRHDIAGIEAHVGGPAAEANDALGADGYATGSSVAFSRTPDLHTAAHEAAHVIQQRAGVHLKGGVGEAGDVHEQHADAVADNVVRGESAETLLDQYSGSGGGGGVQLHIRRDHQVIPGMGILDMDMRARPAPVPAPGQVASMDGFIQFTPTAGAPNSNVIGINQIVKFTVEGQPTNDAPVGTLGGPQAPRGNLGQAGLRTADDPATATDEGGFWVDGLHQNNSAGAGRRAPGTPLSPRYAVEPTTAANQAARWGGSTPGPRGGTGGIGNQSAGGLTPGFKRSDLPEDIRSVAMFDTPGWGGNGDFSFETVARGEDTNTFYTGVTWGFTTHNGTIINERSAVTAGTSPIFDLAMERHRDFYVHEPIVIYFAFDRDSVQATENAKIVALAGYLGRNPHVVMTLDGFADLVGDPTYNVRLSERRVSSARNAIIAAHPAFPAAQIVSNEVVAGRGPTGGHGESTAATDATSEVRAGTGDQGGDAVNGADQNREANRQFNRRVTITFSHPPGTGPAAPGGVGNPAPPAPPAGP
jgi:outer membrane protein OmpA-like peptidoglycan-associated protein